MSKEDFLFNLSQASQELEKIMQRAEAGEALPPPHVLGHNLAVAMNYLCNAWHYREMSREEIEQLTQEQYELLSRTIPNFARQFTLRDNFETLPEMTSPVRREAGS